MLKMVDLDLKNKHVLIREDFNVPMENGHISNDRRLIAALPTIQTALKQNAAVILLSHLGRPKEGEHNSHLSLQPVAEKLSQYLQQTVRFEKEWLNGITIKPGEIVLCENVRFEKGEKNNDPALAKKIAALGDIFVMDAFATAHRAEASTTGVAQFAKIACAGPLLVAELEALSKAIAKPAHPVLAIIGGSKVSTKLMLLENIINRVDQLIVGGGIANTFLAAQGYAIGKSLYEPDLIPQAKNLLALAKQKKVQLPLPVDVVVGTEFSSHAQPKIKAINDILPHDMILDIGPKTRVEFSQLIAKAKTIIWNGPVGVFEFPAFAKGTQTLVKAIAKSHAFSLAGGGETIAAIDQFHLADKISYISTGGGAFLEFLEGKTLPAVEVLG